MAHTGLAVVEARWWSDGNHSVRPLFETLAGIVEENPHAVRYDMFTEKTSLSAVITNLADEGRYHSIYIAAHGDENVISGLGGISISRTELRNILRQANTKGKIKGLYFGSCLVGNIENASFWLTKTPSTRLKWIAGYAKSVDWIDSSAIDMIFWSKYLNARSKYLARKKAGKLSPEAKYSEIEIVEQAANAMKKLMPTIQKRLGFNIWYVNPNKILTPIWDND